MPVSLTIVMMLIKISQEILLATLSCLQLWNSIQMESISTQTTSKRLGSTHATWLFKTYSERELTTTLHLQWLIHAMLQLIHFLTMLMCFTLSILVRKFGALKISRPILWWVTVETSIIMRLINMAISCLISSKWHLEVL